MTVRPTSRFNSPGLAPLTSAAERRRCGENGVPTYDEEVSRVDAAKIRR
jgi:hypothetical protein